MKKLFFLLFFESFAAISFGRSTIAGGKVTDPAGNPLANASVVEKGTRNGTLANEQGMFSLQVKPGARLLISAVGFEVKKIRRCHFRIVTAWYIFENLKAGFDGWLSIIYLTSIAIIKIQKIQAPHPHSQKPLCTWL